MLLRLMDITDARQLTEYHLRNEAFHREWTPLYPPNFLTVEFQARRLQTYLNRHARGEEYRFGVFTTERSPQLIGAIVLSAVERHPFHNGRLGYSIDQSYTNRGIITENVQHVMKYAFGKLSLHRLEASIMPRNGASRRVLEKCGFEKIGYSPRYLKIQGKWEDHEMYMALATESPEPS
jgi:[ribosomal protein S5]-alanine N-acetyltransferase